MRRTTLKDLAEMLQISTSTVSRALKDHPDISNAVKMKVKEAAETFNYVPNDFAVNFRKKSSKVIGLIVPEITMFFIPSIINGISSVLNKEGYHFFILSSNDSFETEKEHLETCINSRVDGILISLTNETKDSEHLKKLKEMEIPTIIFDKTVSQNIFQSIVFDNVKNAELCADKLINHGCKNILAIFGDENLEITQSRLVSFENRIKQFPGVTLNIIYCNSTDFVKEKLDIILNDDSIDGFFAMSDETLMGLHSSLIKRSLNNTNKKVVSISEGTLPKYLDETYEYQINDGYEMGTFAATQLLNSIKNPVSGTYEAETTVHHL
ncbi:LacI family DNA-binding transcriptional regulator [Chryseobacterium balustinum]|uniref:LacI family transcriptional regulator n=1 Tax=Chryseobacterium balustinum TaxID=246 RepID=A0AAX2ISJ4_9FLAO|nr:LacI family DNA-binding transcriptional regulator [Chryseobacterium balustinum]AZB28388.1 LacI family transcriptional regulator [Chryseobacterium balustinum]SKC04458.1 LacI family transcriptional regulator [Chryseobacterium balustinum]SQA92668.1 Maltose operon transcriptional repressor [Chryseobacterium balustinum]